MLSIVFGLIAICLGLWGITTYWWYVVDMLVAVLPVFLLFGGFIALMAGIRNTGIKAKVKNGTEESKDSEEPGLTDTTIAGE